VKKRIVFFFFAPPFLSLSGPCEKKEEGCMNDTLNLGTVKMPELAAILEESFWAERLAASSTDAALGMVAPVCSNDVPARDGLATLAAARHVLGVALGAEWHAVVVLEELGEREQTLAASVALEALLVEPLAEGHDCIALAGDVLVAQGTDKASLLGTVSDQLHAIGKSGNLIARLQRLIHGANRSGRWRVTWRSRWRRRLGGSGKHGSAIVAELEAILTLGTTL